MSGQSAAPGQIRRTYVVRKEADGTISRVVLANYRPKPRVVVNVAPRMVSQCGNKIAAPISHRHPAEPKPRPISQLVQRPLSRRIMGDMAPRNSQTSARSQFAVMSKTLTSAPYPKIIRFRNQPASEPAPPIPQHNVLKRPPRHNPYSVCVNSSLNYRTKLVPYRENGGVVDSGDCARVKEFSSICAKINGNAQRPQVANNAPKPTSEPEVVCADGSEKRRSRASDSGDSGFEEEPLIASQLPPPQFARPVQAIPAQELGHGEPVQADWARNPFVTTGAIYSTVSFCDGKLIQNDCSNEPKVLRAENQAQLDDDDDILFGLGAAFGLAQTTPTTTCQIKESTQTANPYTHLIEDVTHVKVEQEQVQQVNLQHRHHQARAEPVQPAEQNRPTKTRKRQSKTTPAEKRRKRNKDANNNPAPADRPSNQATDNAQQPPPIPVVYVDESGRQIECFAYEYSPDTPLSVQRNDHGQYYIVQNGAVQFFDQTTGGSKQPASQAQLPPQGHQQQCCNGYAPQQQYGLPGPQQHGYGYEHGRDYQHQQHAQVQEQYRYGQESHLHEQPQQQPHGYHHEQRHEQVPHQPENQARQHDQYDHHHNTQQEQHDGALRGQPAHEQHEQQPVQNQLEIVEPTGFYDLNVPGYENAADFVDLERLKAPDSVLDPTPDSDLFSANDIDQFDPWNLAGFGAPFDQDIFNSLDGVF